MSDPRKAKKLFDHAVDIPEKDRGAFLDQACGDDAELRARVDALLGALDKAEDFLVEPEPKHARSEEQAGTEIDRYKLLQLIGEGGFGTVWMAEQLEPVRRKVALKIIKLGMDTKQVIARFEAERQALALMDHPHIAKVLDGGATPGGRPYFVMELVRGTPITEYCDQAKLGTTERLELFQQVCHAVQHAHQKGVIHRDLKPSNVLVTLHDGVPVPKVIDFGIAKATSAELTQKTLFTEYEQILGTPEYMAPEQAELSGLDIDTRADVYSLGVLLYEMLTGTKPFDMQTLLAKGYVEMLRTIREDDPPKPSTRVSTMGDEIATVAQHRHATPKLLSRLIRGDLDWIVMKSLEKDRSRRYASASDFAADVGRYLADDTVLASPPSASYKLRKYVRRHRVGVAVAALVFLALTTGLGVALWGWFEAEDQRVLAEAAETKMKGERDKADTAKSKAEKEAARADKEAKRATASEKLAKEEAARLTAVMELVREMLGSADPNQVKGKGYTVRQLLDDFDQGLGDRLKDQPVVEASVRAMLAEAYQGLGLYAKARAHALRARELKVAVVGADHESIDQLVVVAVQATAMLAKWKDAIALAREHLATSRSRQVRDRRLAVSLVSLASALAYAGQVEEAESSAREALSILGEADDEQGLKDRAWAFSVLATVLNSQNWKTADPDRKRRALQFAEKRLALIRRLHPPGSPQVGQALASFSGMRILTMTDPRKAVRYGKEALKILEKHFEPDHYVLGAVHGTIGAGLRGQGQYQEAIPFLERGLKIYRAHSRRDRWMMFMIAELVICQAYVGEFVAARKLADELLTGEDLMSSSDFAWCLSAMTSVFIRARSPDDLAAAESLMRRVLDLSKEAGWSRRRLGKETYSLASIVRVRGRAEESVKLHRKALELLSESDPLLKATVKASFGYALLEAGQRDEAETNLREAIASMEAVRGKPNFTQRVRGDLQTTRFVLAKALAARKANREAEKLLRTNLDEGPPNGLQLRLLAGLLNDRNEFAEAARRYRQALALLESMPGDQKWERTLSHWQLSITLVNLSKFAAAVEQARKAIALFDRDDDLTLAMFHSTLAQAHAHLGNHEETAKAYEVALARFKSCGQREQAIEMMRGLAWAYNFVNLCRLDKSEPLHRELIEYFRKLHGADHQLVARHQAGLAECLLVRGAFAEAEPVLIALCKSRSKLTENRWLYYNAVSMHGGALTGLGRYDEAEPLVLEAYAKMNPPAIREVRRTQALERVVTLYEKWGKKDKAAEWRAKLQAAKAKAKANAKKSKK